MFKNVNVTEGNIQKGFDRANTATNMLAIGLFAIFALFASIIGATQIIEATSTTVGSTVNSTEITDEGFVTGMAYLGAGIAAVGIGTVGVGQGIAGGYAAQAIGRNPEAEGKIRNQFILAAAFAEASALYILVVIILLLFVMV